MNWNQLGETILSKTFDIILASLLFFVFYELAARIVKKLFKNYSERKWTDSARILTFSRLSTSGIQYVTVFLYIYTILSIIGIPVGSLLAGAGIFGVALGFAGRDLVADVINGFFIIVEHQINVGDTIRFENLNIEGIVKSVGIRSITLIADDGATTFIPNRNIESLKNFSYGDRTLFLDIPVDATTLSKMKAHLLEVNKNYPQVTYLGIFTLEEKLFLRCSLHANLTDLTRLKNEILEKYYEKES